VGCAVKTRHCLSTDGLLAASCQKQGGRGACLVLTPPASKTEFSVLNNLDIDCVSGYFSQLFKLVWGRCVDMAPCWSNILGEWSEDFWLIGLSSSQWGHVSVNSVRYTCILKKWHCFSVRLPYYADEDFLRDHYFIFRLKFAALDCRKELLRVVWQYWF